MSHYISMIIGTIFVSNIALTNFLGLCPFFGVSKSYKSALGMGVAITFVTFGASLITYALYYLVLVPLNIEYMELVSFVLVIASFVQLVEMIIKKYSPSLYKSLGIYLPLITTNCAVLYVTRTNISSAYTFKEMLVYSFATPFGYMLVLYLFSLMRERLEYAETPKYFKGTPISLITAGLMAMALGGLAGLL